MSDVLLKVENLTTCLGSENRPVRVVDGVDLEIRKGETFALLGESGCGKSMTALSLMRLLPLSGRIVEGNVRLDDTELLDLPENAMRTIRGGRMGMIFQEPQTSLNSVMTVGKQIAEAVRLHDKNAADFQARVVELLQAVGIPDPERRAGEYPHQLSGGMKQRIVIAMALAGRPELLIADEPTTALDVTIQAQVLSLLKDLQRESGMAVLLITHDLGVVAETADRLAVMYAGEIVEIAPAVRFFDAPAHPYSRKLFDSLPDAGKRGQKLAVIEGMVPRLDQPFHGCRFADRCGAAVDICRETSPDWQDCGDGQQVRCHRWGEEVANTDADVARPVAESTLESKRLLEVADLQVHFPIHKGLFKRVVGHVKAVDGVDLSLKSGRTVALVGESGCGKTTVGKGILQLIKPTGGSVDFEGRELVGMSGRKMRPLRSDLQIIFQDPFASMNPRMLVGDIVEEGMLAQGIGGARNQRRERIQQLLKQVGVAADADTRYPHEFSGGQRQRIAIARAIVLKPVLLILDEPTSALDMTIQAQVIELLKNLQQRHGMTYIFITHDLRVIRSLADELAVMRRGRIVEQGRADRLFSQPQHPYTKKLFQAAFLKMDELPGKTAHAR